MTQVFTVSDQITVLKLKSSSPDPNPENSWELISQLYEHDGWAECLDMVLSSLSARKMDSPCELTSRFGSQQNDTTDMKMLHRHTFIRMATKSPTSG